MYFQRYCAFVIGLVLACAGCSSSSSDLATPSKDARTQTLQVGNIGSNDTVQVFTANPASGETGSNFQGSLVDFDQKEASNNSSQNKTSAPLEEWSSRSCGTCLVQHLNPNLREEISSIPTFEARTIESLSPRFDNASDGHTEELTVISNGNKKVTVAKIETVGSPNYCNILAEQTDGQNIITRLEAQTIADKFNLSLGTGSTYDQGAYRGVTSIFGTEWNVNGGRDGDTKVNIVLLSEDSISSSSSGLLYGYVTLADAFRKSSVSSSNEGEFVYLNADIFAQSPDDLYATLVHEFQHLCNQNQKVIQDGAFPNTADPENKGINEGLSCLAEDLLGYGPERNIFLRSIGQRYLNDPRDYSLFQEDINSGVYGCHYLFFRYFYGQYGINGIREVATSKNTGIKNLRLVSGLPMKQLFYNWMLATYYSNSSFTNVPPLYQYKNNFFTQGLVYSGVQTYKTSTTASSDRQKPWTFSIFEYDSQNSRTVDLEVTYMGLSSFFVGITRNNSFRQVTQY